MGECNCSIRSRPHDMIMVMPSLKVNPHLIGPAHCKAAIENRQSKSDLSPTADQQWADGVAIRGGPGRPGRRRAGSGGRRPLQLRLLGLGPNEVVAGDGIPVGAGDVEAWSWQAAWRPRRSTGASQRRPSTRGSAV